MTPNPQVRELIEKRAELLRQIRLFFYARKVWEVDTPHLHVSTSPDPQVLSIKSGDNYLQPSPEFFMKKLLAAKSGDIYQLAHVFRDDAKSPRHLKEFMLLEWYRQGFDMFELMAEVFELVLIFLPKLTKTTLSYAKAFKKYAKIDNVFKADIKQLTACWQEYKQTNVIPREMSRTDWLDLIMLDIIEPNLSGAVFIHSYPKEQACLAKVRNNLAQRFELYINGMEIANGFDELNSTDEQHARFVSENNKRQAKGLEVIPLDEDFLTALDKLPACSGVALGVDRLIMLNLGLNNINDVVICS